MPHTWKNYNSIDQAVTLSTGNVWVFGGETVQTPFTLTTARARSANDIWAVGFAAQNGNGAHPPLVGRWDGKKWSVVPTPAIASEPGYSPAFVDISAASATDVWAVGHRYQRTGPQSVANEPLALRWDGMDWSRADPPARQ